MAYPLHRAGIGAVAAAGVDEDVAVVVVAIDVAIVNVAVVDVCVGVGVHIVAIVGHNTAAAGACIKKPEEVRIGAI